MARRSSSTLISIATSALFALVSASGCQGLLGGDSRRSNSGGSIASVDTAVEGGEFIGYDPVTGVVLVEGGGPTNSGEIVAYTSHPVQGGLRFTTIAQPTSSSKTTLAHVGGGLALLERTDILGGQVDLVAVDLTPAVGDRKIVYDSSTIGLDERVLVKGPGGDALVGVYDSGLGSAVLRKFDARSRTTSPFPAGVAMDNVSILPHQGSENTHLLLVEDTTLGTATVLTYDSKTGQVRSGPNFGAAGGANPLTGIDFSAESVPPRCIAYTLDRGFSIKDTIFVTQSGQRLFTAPGPNIESATMSEDLGVLLNLFTSQARIHNLAIAGPTGGVPLPTSSGSWRTSHLPEDYVAGNDGGAGTAKVLVWGFNSVDPHEVRVATRSGTIEDPLLTQVSPGFSILNSRLAYRSPSLGTALVQGRETNSTGGDNGFLAFFDGSKLQRILTAQGIDTGIVSRDGRYVSVRALTPTGGEDLLVVDMQTATLGYVASRQNTSIDAKLIDSDPNASTCWVAFTQEYGRTGQQELYAVPIISRPNGLGATGSSVLVARSPIPNIDAQAFTYKLSSGSAPGTPSPLPGIIYQHVGQRTSETYIQAPVGDQTTTEQIGQ